jgi:hypothetical protein
MIKMGIDRIMVTPTITVDQDKYDNLIRIQERYEKLTNKECVSINEETEHKNFDFGIAIKLIKEGKKVQREGWNGKNQYIELATGISYKNNDEEIVNVFHNDIESKAIAFVGTSGVQLGWLASQADMLAEDWKIVEEK